MASIILSMVLSIVLGSMTWLVIGSRLSLNKNSKQNQLLNLFIYIISSFVVIFAVVFFIIGG